MKVNSEENRKPKKTLPLERLCRNVENSMFVILNPSPPVILSPARVILSEAKDLGLLRGVDSAKDLGPECNEGSAQGKLREESQRINKLQNRDSSANASE